MRALFAVLLGGGCAAGPSGGPQPGDVAWAEIGALDAGGPTAIARFRPSAHGMRVIVLVQGLKPGVYGLHVREGTDCAAPGPHLDATGAPHGGPTSPRGLHHAGDLGNVVEDYGDGTRYESVDDTLAVDGPESILGHAIVLDASADDLLSQPDGRAGAPLACGIVEPAGRLPGHA